MSHTPTQDQHTSASDSSPIRPGTALWRLKLRLQFTGWLQFLPPITAGLVILVVAGIGALAHWPAGVQVTLLVIAGGLWLIAATDLAIHKLGWRPAEARPPAPQGDAFDLMRGRRSCRSFQPADLTEADREAVLDAADRASRVDHLLGTAPIRFEYAAARLTVWPTVGAHEFLVAIAPRAYDRTAVIDIGRSLQEVVLDATRRGIATCWIGPGADQSSIAAALGDRFDPAADHVVCVCAIGYRSRLVPLVVRLLTRTMSGRRPLTELFFADDALRRPVDTTAPPYDELGRCYEAARWSPSSYNAQPTRASVHTEGGRVTRVDFRQSVDSRFYAPVALGIWLTDWEHGCRALRIAGHAEVRADADPRYGASWVRDD